MNKVYVVERDGRVEQVFFTEEDAHSYAEWKYGSKSDGICVEGVGVVAYVPITELKDV
jgi:hypothetical protein